MNMIGTQVKLQEAIRELEALSKQGESYSDDEGSYGWRNPIRSDTGPLLASQVAGCNPKLILEVGTGHGLSALHMMSGLSSLEGCRLDTIEFDEDIARGAQVLFDDLGVPIVVHCGEALEVIQQRLSGPYELVFLDAQKTHYGKQLRALMDGAMLASGCTLLIDNVIDRRVECTDLFNTLEVQDIAYHILPTQCGLLVAGLPEFA